MSLFNDYYIKDYLDKKQIEIKAEVEKFSNEEIMANDTEVLADNCYEKLKIESLEIGGEDTSKRKLSQTKIPIKSDMFTSKMYQNECMFLDGVCANYSYPFTGDQKLFSCRASTYQLSGYPNPNIAGGFITFSYCKSLNELNSDEKIKKLEVEHARDLQKVREGVKYVNQDIDLFNDSLRVVACGLLAKRKEKVEQFYTLSEIFNIPLERSEYATSQIPMQRRIVPISKVYKEEQSYQISDAEYCYILETLKHMGSTYERTPRSYKCLQEEDLRNILLAALNGMYKGGATGEAFRNNGKTDICIEKDNRAAFVAECKMWTGTAAIPSAIEQLVKYLTWRDCKTALIFFVRNRDFLGAIDSATDALRKFSLMREINAVDKNEFDCIIYSALNNGQLIKIRVMFFNLYCNKE